MKKIILSAACAILSLSTLWADSPDKLTKFCNDAEEYVLEHFYEKTGILVNVFGGEEFRPAYYVIAIELKGGGRITLKSINSDEQPSTGKAARNERKFRQKYSKAGNIPYDMIERVSCRFLAPADDGSLAYADYRMTTNSRNFTIVHKYLDIYDRRFTND